MGAMENFSSNTGSEDALRVQAPYDARQNYHRRSPGARHQLRLDVDSWHRPLQTATSSKFLELRVKIASNLNMRNTLHARRARTKAVLETFGVPLLCIGTGAV